MNTAKCALVVTNNDYFAKEVEAQFEKLLSNQFSFKVTSFHEVLNHPKEQIPTLILIDLGEAEEFIFSTVKRICSHFESSRVVCAGQLSDVSIVLEFVKMGVKDFIKFPFEAEELSALSKGLLKQIRANEINGNKQDQKAGKIITVYSPKGGSGLTLLAANLAVSLAEKDPQQSVRVNALLALARMRVQKAVPVLVKMCADSPDSMGGYDAGSASLKQQMLRTINAITGISFKDTNAVQAWWKKTGGEEHEPTPASR